MPFILAWAARWVPWPLVAFKPSWELDKHFYMPRLWMYSLPYLPRYCRCFAKTPTFVLVVLLPSFLLWMMRVRVLLVVKRRRIKMECTREGQFPRSRSLALLRGSFRANNPGYGRSFSYGPLFVGSKCYSVATTKELARSIVCRYLASYYTLRLLKR
jgi:hypothetical protein